MSLDSYRNSFRGQLWLRKIDARKRLMEAVNKATGAEREELVKAYRELFGIKTEYCLPL